MKKHRWTAARQQQFLDHLAETGNVIRSVRLVGTSPARIYALRRDDPAFRQAWEAAEEIAADRLEQEAWRRAVEGFDEPLVSGGRLVKDEDGTPLMLRRYSDTLLITLLKAHRPGRFGRRLPTGPGEGEPISGGAVSVDIRAMLLTKLAQLAQHVDRDAEPESEAAPAEPE
jgi:hypothetical protein